MFGVFKRRAAAQGRIGIAVGREHVAIAVVMRDADHLRLTRCEVLPVDPSAGPEAVAAIVRAAGLPRLPISSVLRTEDYQLALVEAPDVPPAELRAAMRWRLKDAIDFRVEDAVVDVFDVPAQNRGGHGRMMYAVAARRDAVDRCAAALAGAPGFDVVDVPELCLRNLASSLLGVAGGIALLHLGEVAATVILVRGTTFYFARQMDLQAIQRTAAGRDGGVTVDSTGIVLELQRSLDYYERHFDQPPITRIAVTHCGPQALALTRDLKRDTGFEVTALDLNSVLQCAVPIAPDTQAACLMAVGAAMRVEHRSL